MIKPNIFGWLLGAAKDAQSSEGLEANTLQKLEATMVENDTLKAQLSEATEKLASANKEVETAMANVVAERAKLAEDRTTFDAYVKEKTAWLDEPAAEPAKVKEGFQPNADAHEVRPSWELQAEFDLGIR